MNIDRETVDKIAHLARLDMAENDKQEMIGDMNRILDFMAKLNEVDTSGVEPLVYMSAEVNVLREDVARQDITTEEALENAPKHNDQYFMVAKVIG